VHRTKKYKYLVPHPSGRDVRESIKLKTYRYPQDKKKTPVLMAARQSSYELPSPLESPDIMQLVQEAAGTHGGAAALRGVSRAVRSAAQRPRSTVR
jgi:hypothetical protein